MLKIGSVPPLTYLLIYALYLASRWFNICFNMLYSTIIIYYVLN